MNYYNHNQQPYMNRASRRKNGIKTPKVPKAPVRYTQADLEKVLKRELTKLINEPYTETLKRQQYKRLEPLIKKYQEEKKYENKKEHSNNKNLNMHQRLYNSEREKLKNNETYKKLNSYYTTRTSSTATNRTSSQNYTRKKAINAYQSQMEFSRSHKSLKQTAVMANKQTATPMAKNKKGLFARILDAFRLTKAPQPIQYKQNIIQPKTIQEAKRYKKSPTQIRSVEDYSFNKFDHAVNKFEMELRNFQNYSKDNKSYQYVKNGRDISNMRRPRQKSQRYEPRYL